MNTQNSIEESTPDDKTPEQGVASSAEHRDREAPAHVGHAHRFIYGYLLLLVVAALAGLGTYLYHRYYDNNKTTKAVHAATSEAATTQPSSDVCFIVSDNLECVNASGQDPVTYALPVIGGSPISLLMPNDTDTQYLASAGGSLWLLDGKLNSIRELSFPAGLQHNASSAVSWSHDGKYLLIELDGANNDRQIYKYILASSVATKLTSSGYNSTPYETQDGHILYTHFSGTGNGWMPYIMNADGSGATALTALSDPTEFAGLSYDPTTDTVFVTNFGDTATMGSGSLSYETVNDVRSGVKPKTINLNVQSTSDGALFMASNSTIVWYDAVAPNTTTGQIINLSTGAVEHTIPQYGTPVGVLKNIKSANLASAKPVSTTQTTTYAGWKTCNDEADGVSFQYPSDWTIASTGPSSDPCSGMSLSTSGQEISLQSPSSSGLAFMLWFFPAVPNANTDEGNSGAGSDWQVVQSVAPLTLNNGKSVSLVTYEDVGQSTKSSDGLISDMALTDQPYTVGQAFHALRGITSPKNANYNVDMDVSLATPNSQYVQSHSLSDYHAEPAYGELMKILLSVTY